MEGTLCYNPSSRCDTSGKVLPVTEYSHATGCSVTGGYVYRGLQSPALQGVYLYADYCEGLLFGLVKNSSAQWETKLIADTPYTITSFGEAEDGELFITDYASGSVIKIVPPPTTTAIYRSQAANDGYVTELNESSGTGGAVNAKATVLRIGDNPQNKQYRAILSFNTGASLPDNAVITKVTLKVKKASVVGGGDPLNTFGGFVAQIKKGTFGRAALTIRDFQTTANAATAAVKPPLVNSWYSIDMTSVKAYVNTTGITQIRLRFKLDDNNNLIANYLKLYSGNALMASRPQLIVEYYVP